MFVSKIVFSRQLSGPIRPLTHSRLRRVYELTRLVKDLRKEGVITGPDARRFLADLRRGRLSAELIAHINSQETEIVSQVA